MEKSISDLNEQQFNELVDKVAAISEEYEPYEIADYHGDMGTFRNTVADTLLNDPQAISKHLDNLFYETEDPNILRVLGEVEREAGLDGKSEIARAYATENPDIMAGVLRDKIGDGRGFAEALHEFVELDVDHDYEFDRLVYERGCGFMGCRPSKLVDFYPLEDVEFRPLENESDAVQKRIDEIVSKYGDDDAEAQDEAQFE